MPLDGTTPKKPRTEKQKEASRANGARSRGASPGQTHDPKAERYGRLAQVLLLPEESRKIFMTLADEFVQSLNPQTPIQHLLIGKMLAAHWRQNRLWGAGNSVTPTSLADENRLDRQFYRAYDRYFRQKKNNEPPNNLSDSSPDTYPPSGTPPEPEKTRDSATAETVDPVSNADEDAVAIESLTKQRPGASGEGRTFASTDDVLIALEMGEFETLTPIKLRYTGKVIDLTRAFDSQNIVHTEPIEFLKQYMDSYLKFGLVVTVKMLDDVKSLGFLYATRAGISIGVDDMVVPAEKVELVANAEKDVVAVESQYQDVAITSGERHNKIIEIWSRVTEKVSDMMFSAAPRQGIAEDDHTGRYLNPIYIMADSGARAGEWLKKHLQASYEPLLDEPWALDIDSTVKLLYGHRENAKVGYNPTRPGRPSHAFHSYFIANLRLVADVEVQAGNRTASSFAQPELWKMLDSLKESGRAPSFLRGDCAWGTDRAMQGAEERNIAYLFKLKQTANVKKLIARLFGRDGWEDAGQSWEGLETELQLSGWKKKRRVLLLRRALREIADAEKSARQSKAARQLNLDLPEAEHCGVRYEYSVLITSLGGGVRAIAQHYRDRGDAENNFDELKNQWGWAGFTTRDSKRCQIMARITALIYNWWTIFMRLGLPDQHAEAITSRPLAMYGIARRTKHANQITVDVTSMHAKAFLIGTVLSNVSSFLKRISSGAEQWTQAGR